MEKGVLINSGMVVVKAGLRISETVDLLKLLHKTVTGVYRGWWEKKKTVLQVETPRESSQIGSS